MAGDSTIAERDGDRVPADRSLDLVFGLLADRRRRFVLACLADRTGSTSRRELARAIAVRENESPIDEVPDEVVENVAVSLAHKHLPKLAEAGVVEYDQVRGLVRPAETADGVGQVLSETVLAMVDPAADRCQINLGHD